MIRFCRADERSVIRRMVSLHIVPSIRRKALRYSALRELVEIVRQAQSSRWLEENKNALDEYNRRIETCGTFSDGLQRF